jgi:hypothetical protein
MALEEEQRNKSDDEFTGNAQRLGGDSSGKEKESGDRLDPELQTPDSVRSLLILSEHSV